MDLIHGWDYKNSEANGAIVFVYIALAIIGGLSFRFCCPLELTWLTHVQPHKGQKSSFISSIYIYMKSVQERHQPNSTLWSWWPSGPYGTTDNLPLVVHLFIASSSPNVFPIGADLCHKVTVCLTIWGNCFSKQLSHLTITPAGYEHYHLFTSWQHLLMFASFDSSHRSWCEVAFHSGFDLFPDD